MSFLPPTGKPRGTRRARIPATSRRALVCTAGAALLALAPAADATKYAGEFLTQGIGARSLGMGRAHVAVPVGATASYWNPAVLVFSERRDSEIMHSEEFGDVRYDGVSLVLPHSGGTGASASGLGLIRLAIDDIPDTRSLQWLDYGADGDPNVTDVDGTQDNGAWDAGERLLIDPGRIRLFSNSEMALFLSHARSLTGSLAAGASAKVVRKTLDDHDAWGFGFDLAARFDAGRGLALGANLQDAFGTYLSWDTGRRETISPNLKLGAAWTRDVSFPRGRFLAAADLDVRFEGRRTAATWWVGDRLSADPHLGGELQVGLLALRAGLDVDRPTLGVGLSPAPFHVDYAFRGRSDAGEDDLDASHRVSAGIAF